MLISKAYKYRIYPTKEQCVRLTNTFGCVRFIWNKNVETFNTYNKETNPEPIYRTQKELKEEFAWLSGVSAGALQQKVRDFEEFKKQYFSKTRKTSIGRPSFKNKHNDQSYRLPNQKFTLMGDVVKVEKIGKVKVVVDREIPENAKIMSATISKNRSNEYYISISVQVENIKHKPKTGKTVGVDLGLKEFATLSNGNVVHNPRYYREKQSKLKRIQQHLSRKQKGSRRREKCRLKVARCHRDVTNCRKWFLHNETTKLVNNYDVICIEDLNVAGMVKNHNLAKSISDASFSEFRSMLEYKCKWYGKELTVIGRFEPSSKTCSCCGWKNDNLKLSDRTFKCGDCGMTIDRDANASRNIQRLGVESLNERREGGYKLDEAFRTE